MSDILRLIAGGLLALICCWIGVMIKKRYKDRLKFYTSVCDYGQMMASELSFKKTPIPQIAQKFTQGRSGEFERVLNECISIAQDGKGAEYAVEKVTVAHLKKEEKTELFDFLCGQGKSALDDQLATVAHYNESFEKKRKKCEEDSKKLGNMYFKLCVLLGIAIMLILA